MFPTSVQEHEYSPLVLFFFPSDQSRIRREDTISGSGAGASPERWEDLTLPAWK